MAPSFVGFTTPGHFAIIGAAALTAAATGTMSTAVVCLELTGQLSLQLPILVATVAGYLGAKALNVTSLFDVFIRLKHLPGIHGAVKRATRRDTTRHATHARPQRTLGSRSPSHRLYVRLTTASQVLALSPLRCLPCRLSGAALGSSHASRNSARRGTSVQKLGIFGRLHRIRLPRHVTHAKLKAFLPR